MARRPFEPLGESTRRRLRIALVVVLASAIGGAIYGMAADGRAIGLVRGVVTGALISVPLATFELVFVQARAGHGLRRLSFVRLLALKSAIYLIVFALALGLTDAVFSGAFHFNRGFAGGIVFSAGFAFVINFVLQIDRLLGRGMLAAFVVGRYHRPREEERIFLFLDLVGSTALAERLGGPRFMEFLNRVYRDIAGPIVAHRGEIHKYVGDEVIVTWLPKDGIARANCARLPFAIMARLLDGAPGYTETFGAVPRFRFALHYGTVVSGELGDLKQEIAFLGDAMNTTARLVDACREHGVDCIASGDMLGRLALPVDVAARPLGAIGLRGKAEPLTLFALSAAA